MAEHALVGKTTFVTGGASGIGLAIGRTFAEAGMRVMLADIEARALEQAIEAFQGTHHDR
jgi:NAD(P)-dependent dehydrogenase (short-subunit alcohol dehydrogenase family)